MQAHPETNFTYYVILLCLIPGKETTVDHIKKHIAYLRGLDQEGRLLMCGPFSNQKGGMVIIRASNLEEAAEVAARDPFVQDGIRTFEVREWKISCEANNHLGMG